MNAALWWWHHSIRVCFYNTKEEISQPLTLVFNSYLFYFVTIDLSTVQEKPRNSSVPLLKISALFWKGFCSDACCKLQICLTPCVTMDTSCPWCAHTHTHSLWLVSTLFVKIIFDPHPMLLIYTVFNCCIFQQDCAQYNKYSLC